MLRVVAFILSAIAYVLGRHELDLWAEVKHYTLRLALMSVPLVGSRVLTVYHGHFRYLPPEQDGVLPASIVMTSERWIEIVLLAVTVAVTGAAATRMLGVVFAFVVALPTSVMFTGTLYHHWLRRKPPLWARAALPTLVVYITCSIAALVELIRLDWPK